MFIVKFMVLFNNSIIVVLFIFTNKLYGELTCNNVRKNSYYLQLFGAWVNMHCEWAYGGMPMCFVGIAAAR